MRLGEGFAIGTPAFELARERLVGECRARGRSRWPFRDLLGVGRRSAQLLLERFDSDGLTRRVGEARVLRRRAVGSPGREPRDG
jgi:hypothetical protein